MRRATWLRGLAFAGTLLAAAAAQAQVFRAYLASTGNDANPCSLAAPCRLLPAALAAVADGGEIWMLDSANYNTATVNIAKSVAILAVPGAVGSVVATNGNAIHIATAGVKVALRNLVVVPLPGAGGLSGIVMSAGAGLTVEDCVIANLPTYGISVQTPATVRVSDTTIRDNGHTGILLADGARAVVTRTTISGSAIALSALALVPGASVTVDIADSTADGNAIGINAGAGDATTSARMTVHRSRIVRHSGHGVSGQSGGGPVVITVSHSLVAENNNGGIAALSPPVRIWATGNTVVGNAFVGLYNFGGTFESAGNNGVRHNGGDASPTVAVVETR